MSIYSGFSTRKLEYEYNICIDQLLSLFSTRSIKHIQGDRVDEVKFKKIFKKQFKYLQKMEGHKYLHPKFSETLIPLARALNLKIMDPVRISLQKDSKVDLRENTIQITTTSNPTINESQNTKSNKSLTNSKSRCFSAIRGAPTINIQQRPVSMEMRNRREYINKNDNILDQQGVIQIKDSLQNANQYQMLTNNVIKINNVEYNEQTTTTNNKNSTNQIFSTIQNPKQKKSISISEEKNVVNISSSENKNKGDECKTLLQSKKQVTHRDEKEIIGHTEKKQQNQEKQNNLCQIQMKIIEKSRCLTPSEQKSLENQFFVKQQQADLSKQRNEDQQINNENNDKSIRSNKGRPLKQTRDNLQLRRKSQTQELPHNLRIEINIENTPNTCTSQNTNGGQLTQKNQFGFVNPILKRSTKYINNLQPQNPNNYKQKESDSSKSLHIEQSPQKCNTGYNSFYVESSSIKNLNKNFIQQQQKQNQNTKQNNTKNHANNQLPQGILKEVQNLNTSTNSHQNQHSFSIKFNDMYKQQNSTKNKSNISQTIGVQLNKGQINNRSKNQSLKYINSNNISIDQNQILPSQKTSRETSIDYDSSFKEFLLNNQKQDTSETQFRNKMMVQHLNVIQDEINIQQAQSKSQTQLIQNQLQQKENILNEIKPSNPLMKVNFTENPEPLKSYQTHFLPHYSATSKQNTSHQSPRFDSETFGMTDNPLSLTPIKQIVKRKKSKKKKSQNDKNLSYSFGTNTPKISYMYSQKYPCNISPRSYKNEFK